MLVRHRKMESIDAMNFGELARKKLQFLALLVAALSFLAVPQAGYAQEDTGSVPQTGDVNTSTDEQVAENRSVAEGETVLPDEAGGFEHFGPDMIRGMPTDAGINVQDQFSPIGQAALPLHTGLVWVMFVISIFVLGLLAYVVFRYNRRANKVPSKTSHNTTIEIIWTIVPVIILVIIAIPSITLLAKQYESAPEDAITIKANGYQWFWGYEYVDNGGFEVISNMLSVEEALDAGEPHQLAVDNRMVVPVGVPIRLQTFGADVIHSFGIPSLWFKLDAVPGRINELMLTIEEEGIYYGQCMELCGALHGYMPITIEARSLEDYNRWVQTQPGGQTVEQLRAQAAQEAAAAAATAAEDEESAEDAAEAGDEEAEAEAEEAAAEAA